MIDYNTMSDTTQITPEVFNNALSKSIQAMACGPDCQKQRNIQKLKQKYLKARQNVQTAPEQLEQAKNKYILAERGQSGYTAYLNTQQAADTAHDISAATISFQSDMDKANNSLRTYTALYTSYNTNSDLYNSYLAKNINLDELNGQIITSDRKIHYSIKTVDDLDYWSWYLKRIYAVLLFVLLYILMVKSVLSIHIKIFIFILFILIPLIQLIIIPKMVDWIHRNTLLIQNKQL